MNKAILVVFVTSHLLCQAAYFQLHSSFSTAALELQSWTGVEHNIGNSSCMKHLKTQMDEACKQLGEGIMVSVDFANCKMGCQKDATTASVKPYNMPNGTSCGFYDEKCQNGICVGQCEMGSEESFESPGINV
uniref:Putative ixostatin n=1 Tax=Ixodes ricinus TaxID=34613 RepID=A0A0K8RLF8_IXORI